MAQARDRAADGRDHRALEHDSEWDSAAAQLDGKSDARIETFLRLVAVARERAAIDRAVAAEQRERAATDREQAAHDRMHAAADRLALIDQLSLAETDVLTGARTRGPGLADLEAEMNRARRMSSELIVAYVDVIGLKILNDTCGHPAGDALLALVVRAIQSHLRSYDLVVRVGGDEFLCVLSGATVDEARDRFDAIKTTLRTEDSDIEVGLAALAPDDTAETLIARADAALPVRRRGRRQRRANGRYPGRTG